VSESSDECAALLLVGHNPGMEGLIRYLTGQPESMPTAAVAVIDLDIGSWKELDEGGGKLIHLYRPRDEMTAQTTHPF